MNYLNKILAFAKNLLKILFFTLCFFLKPLEKLLTKKHSKLPLKHQPLFIIGAPRTGSTILYQVLTNQFDVLYFDNLICFLYKIPFIGFMISNFIFKNSAHNCFKSNHGNTRQYGLHAPSECGGFWYRWLPEDRHFIDYSEIDSIMVKQIIEEISAIINYFNKPLVFKNLNAGQRLRLLKKCFPDARFIYIKRDPLYVTQSILKAKRRIGLKDSNFWSIMPPNIEKLRNLDGYEQVVKQIYYLQKQIEKDLHLFPEKNILTLDYKYLECKLNKVMDECKTLIAANSREKFKKANVRISEQITLEPEEIEKIKNEIKNLNW